MKMLTVDYGIVILLSVSDDWPVWRSLFIENEGNMDLWNVSILPYHYMVSHPRRTQLEC